MAWKKNKYGKYSMKQRHRIAALCQKQPMADIARVVGCEPQTINYIKKQAVREGWREVITQPAKRAKKGALATAPSSPGAVPGLEAAAYYRWVAAGALSKVNGESYIDRLLADLNGDAFMAVR